MVYNERLNSYFSPLGAGDRSAGAREPLLTGRQVPAKTESVSESLDKITGECLRLQLFLCRPRRKFSRENRAPTRSGTASAFWRWRRRHLRSPARTPVSTTSRKRQGLEPELCIATFLHAMH